MSIEYDALYKDYQGVVCFLSTEDKILYTNESFRSLLGYTETELIGRDIFELINPEDRSEFTNNALVSNKKIQMTIRLYHKSGSHLYVSLHSFRFKDKYLLIGDRVKRNYMSFNFDTLKEEGLNIYKDFQFDADNIKDVIDENIDTIRIALDNLPIDFWIKDKDHRYLYMNSIMLTRTNILEKEYYLKNDFELFDKHIANDFVTSDLEAIRAKKKTQYTFESKSARFVKWTEVSKVPLYNVRGEPIGLIGCAIDISESKNNEQKLLQENHVWLELISTIFDFVMCLDADGVICMYHDSNTDESEMYVGKEYTHVYASNRKLLSFVEASYNGVESEFTTIISNQSYHLQIKPLTMDEKVVKVILYGTKNGGE